MSLTPYSYREQFLAALSDNTIVLPEALTRETKYLAKIAGADVTIPSAPRNRYETYLAKICGEDVAVPTPASRLEMYLYKAGGGDVEVPVPVSREETFWNDYLESGPKDLMDGVAVESGTIGDSGSESSSTNYKRTDYIPVTGITSVEVDMEIAKDVGTWYLRVHAYDDNKEWDSMKMKKTIANTTRSAQYTADITGASYIRLAYRKEAEIHVYDASDASDS